MESERGFRPEVEPQRESEKSDFVTLAELLERSELDSEPTTKELLKLFIAEHPALSEVGVAFITPEDEADTGGYFQVVSVEDGVAQPMVFLMLGQQEQMRHLMESRRQSVEMCAELLGIDPAEMTPELLGQFIMSHELGHANDFMKNYLAQHEASTDAAEEWHEHYDANLMSLPVAGLDPAELREAIAAGEDFSAVIEQRSDISTLEELQQAQEIAYRQSPYESYADQIAADLLKKHASQFGLEFGLES